MVATNIVGVSGREMLAALVAGERDPVVLAQLARRRLRAKISQLEEAFTGHFTENHAFLLGRMLARVDALTTDIAALDDKIEAELALSRTRSPDWMTSPASVRPPRPSSSARSDWT